MTSAKSILLVLDEVGIQRGSNGEKVILNQVIDRRLSSMRPVGILTNLNHDELLGRWVRELSTVSRWMAGCG